MTYAIWRVVGLNCNLFTDKNHAKFQKYPRTGRIVIKKIVHSPKESPAAEHLKTNYEHLNTNFGPLYNREPI